MAEGFAPDWALPTGVRAWVSTRAGGVSRPPWDTLNLGDHVGDDPLAVVDNRRRLMTSLPAEPVWLQQVHGTACVEATPGVRAVADAAWTRKAGRVCAVLTADCLPVLFCDQSGSVVAAAHAGWRGLAAGVLEATVRTLGTDPSELLAWIGPAIGPTAFEVGDEVRAAFVAASPSASAAFSTKPNGKLWCDLPELAVQRLAAIGVKRVTRSGLCTVSDPARFFSYRRDGETGRFASLIWRE